jgi:hypothetical protein
MTPSLPQSATSGGIELSVDDLADRLRGPQGPELMRELRQHFDDLRAKLQAEIGRGADSLSFEQLQAALRAVDAARDILKHLPVRSEGLFDSPLTQTPRPIQRSAP